MSNAARPAKIARHGLIRKPLQDTQREHLMISVSLRGLLLALLTATFASIACGAPSEDDNKKIFDEAKQAAVKGPSDVALAGQATLHLPAGLAFVPQPHAQRVLNAMGNPGSDSRLQGLVFPAGDGGWFAVVRYEAAGYIKDDDAREWNADDLLKSFREGTEASNAERKKMGVPEMEIVGWAEKPAYDAATHRLVWAMSSRDKGAPANAEQGVNYNTYALGREGYFSINLVTDLKALPAHKPAAASLLGALDYRDGKRYADFNASTDKVAEYGLAALVLGVGAKKLGLFAVIAAFVAKFAKIAILGAVAFGGAIFKFLKRKPNA
jgi:uncharacterized membrane-anchored protein